MDLSSNYQIEEHGLKLVVFGASGRTGVHVVEQALAAGHTVTAFVRNPSKISIQHPNPILFQGDVMDAAAVEEAIAGQEGVISALGPVRPPVPGMLENAAGISWPECIQLASAAWFSPAEPAWAIHWTGPNSWIA